MIKELGIRTNDLLHCLQNSVEADGFKLEDFSPKMLHKIPNGFISFHPDVEKTSDALFSHD